MPRGLWACGRVQRSRVQSQDRNRSVYGPRMVYGKMGHEERYLLPCHDFIFGLFLCCEPSYHLILSPRQVLTWIVPYIGGDYDTIARRVGLGERPSRPKDWSQRQWLPDPVWGVIKTGWSHKRDHRGELSIVYRIFWTSSKQVQDVKVGGSSALSNGNSNGLKVLELETVAERRGKLLPRFASLFQFLRDSEPEIQRRVNEMDMAGPPTFPPIPS